jgi:hypothetical protein
MDAFTRHISDDPALTVLAKFLRQMPYSEFMELARDLHSDSEILGKSPFEVAELLGRWIVRRLEPSTREEATS